MVDAVAEVTESEAQDKIKSLYADIKATLRVPYVAPVFRRLARYPDYLLPAWSALKPNAQTAYFEQQADAIRQACREAVTSWKAPAAIDASLTSVIQLLEDVEPKYFLATAALRSATNGSRPLMQRISLEEKRQIEPGIPDGAPAITADEPATDDERLRALLGEARALTRASWTPMEFRALIASYDGLQTAVSALEPLSTGAEYRRLLTRLRILADGAVGSVPFRMDISPHVLRQSGLSERDIDSVRETLQSAYLIGSSTVLHVSLLSAGASTVARRSGSAEPARPA